MLREAPPELGDPATEDVTGRVLFGLGGSGSTRRRSGDRPGAGVPAEPAGHQRRLVGALDHQLPGRHRLGVAGGDGGGRRRAGALAGPRAALPARSPERRRRLGRDRRLVPRSRPHRPRPQHARADRPGAVGPAGRGPGGRPSGGRRGPAVPAGRAGRRRDLARAGASCTPCCPRGCSTSCPRPRTSCRWRPWACCNGRPGPPPARSGRAAPRGDRWSAARLEQLRAAGDPLADRVVGELAASGELGQVNGLFRMLIHSGDPLPAELPAGGAGVLPLERRPARLDRPAEAGAGPGAVRAPRVLGGHRPVLLVAAPVLRVPRRGARAGRRPPASSATPAGGCWRPPSSSSTSPARPACRRTAGACAPPRRCA